MSLQSKSCQKMLSLSSTSSPCFSASVRAETSLSQKSLRLRCRRKDQRRLQFQLKTKKTSGGSSNKPTIVRKASSQSIRLATLRPLRSWFKRRVFQACAFAATLLLEKRRVKVKCALATVSSTRMRKITREL